MDPATANILRIGSVLFIILVASVSVHEWAHAFAADKLGDSLPRRQGRVTLNPLAHIDLIGTVILPLLMIFSPLITGGGMMFIGWGRPVEISLPNVKTRMRDDLLITAAGPLSNILIALVVSVLSAVLIRLVPNYVQANQVLDLMLLAIQLNVTLFIFNLIPVPPLDGAHFLKYMINMSEESFHNLSRWGFLIILLLINLGPFRYVLWGTIGFVVTLFQRVILFLVSL